MKISDKAMWDRIVAANKDNYGKGILRYAKAWAELMEANIDAGHALSDIYEPTSHQSDTEGITGFMFGAAVSILSKCWAYGEDLRVVHNKALQIGDEGDKANTKPGVVLNPAVWCIEQ